MNLEHGYAELAARSTPSLIQEDINKWQSLLEQGGVKVLRHGGFEIKGSGAVVFDGLEWICAEWRDV